MTATLTGFDLLAGGGLGRTANKPNTWPAVAQPLGYVRPRACGRGGASGGRGAARLR